MGLGCVDDCRLSVNKLKSLCHQDLRDFVAKQCYISGIVRPSWLGGPYIDLRSSATAYFSQVAASPHVLGFPNVSTRALGTANISTVLSALRLEPFEGREHSGIDDVKNIARILQELVRAERGWKVTANAHIRGKDRRWDWMNKTGKVVWDHPPGA